MEGASLDVGLRDRQPQLCAGLVEAPQPLLGDRGGLPMDKGDLSMALIVHVPDQLRHARHVVGQHRAAAVEHVVQRDGGDVAVHQLDHGGVREIHRGDDHAVAVAVFGVLIIVHVKGADIPGDEGDIVTASLRLLLYALQYPGEVLVAQPAGGLVHEQDPDVVGPSQLQRPRGGVGQIPHLLGHLADVGGRFRVDVAVAVEGLADGGAGHVASLGDIRDRDHAAPSFLFPGGGALKTIQLGKKMFLAGNEEKRA